MTLSVRPMTAGDIPACTEIVNDIIARGSTTAYEKPFSEEAFDAHYRNEPPISMVAINDGRIIGVQAVFEVEPGLYSIGSFTDRRAQIKGAGTALFKATLAATKTGAGQQSLQKSHQITSAD